MKPLLFALSLFLFSNAFAQGKADKYGCVAPYEWSFVKKECLRGWPDAKEVEYTDPEGNKILYQVIFSKNKKTAECNITRRPTTLLKQTDPGVWKNDTYTLLEVKRTFILRSNSKDN